MDISAILTHLDRSWGQVQPFVIFCGLLSFTSGKEKESKDSTPLSRKQLRFNAKYLSQKGRSLLKKYRHTVPEHTCLKIEGTFDQIDQDYMPDPSGMSRILERSGHQ